MKLNELQHALWVYAKTWSLACDIREASYNIDTGFYKLTFLEAWENAEKITQYDLLPYYFINLMSVTINENYWNDIGQGWAKTYINEVLTGLINIESDGDPYENIVDE